MLLGFPLAANRRGSMRGGAASCEQGVHGVRVGPAPRDDDALPAESLLRSEDIPHVRRPTIAAALLGAGSPCQPRCALLVEQTLYQGVSR